MTSQKEQSSLWKALSNPIRRDLIVFIGERGLVSFTEIRDHFKIKVGTLYHHLDTLGSLISQDENKLYFLSEKGKRALALIEDDIDISAAEQPYFGRYTVLHKVFLRDLFNFINKDPLRFLGFSILLLSIMLVSFYFLSITNIFMMTSPIYPNYYAPIFSLCSIIISAGLAELFVRLFFGKKEGFFSLSQAFIVINLPLLLFAVIQYFFYQNSYPYYPWEMEPWLFVLFIFLQLFYLGCFIEAIVVIKSLRLEKAGFIALLVSYFTNLLGTYIINLFGG